MPPTTGVNLKQVAKQFNDALYVIREDAPGIEALEPQAIAWLKDARYTIMCKLEEAFNQLEASREKPPQLRPKWIDPSHRLYLATDSIPIELRPYAEEFRKNLHVLLLNCDFTSCTASISMFGHIELSISFPAVTRALCVEDEFSRASGRESRGTLSAARFAGPLRDLRGKLFKDTLAEMRDVAQDFDTLEPQAIAWLRGARLKVMRQIESSYYELERSRNDLRVPDWVDPSRCLYISTDRVEMPLRPYAPAFCASLSALLSSCDFPSFSAVFCNVFYVMTITISFPAQQRLFILRSILWADWWLYILEKAGQRVQPPICPQN
ncbi:hypothetical protein C8J57DRAFT_1536432 [Mycena rebaudengoi]|nr:hypothetical protein C8J57DRAFT_1536432 [Mycena rebaudengoi]